MCRNRMRIPKTDMRYLLALFLCFSFSWAAAAESRDERIAIGYLFSDGMIPVTLSAFHGVIESDPELRQQVSLRFFTESLIDETSRESLTQLDVLVLDMMNEGMLDQLNARFDMDLLAELKRNGRSKVLVVGSGIRPQEWFTEQGADWNSRAAAYWEYGGAENHLALLKYAISLSGLRKFELPDPVPSLDFGFYFPDEAGGRVFPDWESFAAWRSARGLTGEGRPRIAIGFYKANYYNGEMAVVDALIAEVQRQGADPIPLFGYPGHVAMEHLLLDEDGKARADAAIALFLRFADFDAQKRLAKVDIPLINAITLYGRSEAEWLESTSGLSQFEGTYQVAVPELAGLIAPTVVGSREKQIDPVTGTSVAVNTPIADRVEAAVARSLGYAKLAAKPATEKKVALMYYNYPVGKATIGASYLNIPESLSLILQAMKDRGYQVGDKPLDPDSILADLIRAGRNIMGDAPGELEELVAGGKAALIPVEEYQSWLERYYVPELREKILSDWGNPAAGQLMTYHKDGQSYLVVPYLEYGNILLMPQPARAWSEDLNKLYHAKDLAPHHQYVAAYTWLRHTAKVDAVVHMGTHGTLEWLDGKDIGLSAADASDALIADLPDIYVYNVDVVGEGLVARRRGAASLVDHMVPSFVRSEHHAQLAELNEAINDFDANIHKNPELANAFAGNIIEQVIAANIDKNLGLDLEGRSTLTHEEVHQLVDYLLELRSQHIPYGMHAFGRLPSEEARKSTVDAIISIDRSALPEATKVLAADMEERIVSSAAREIDNLLHALDGGYLPGGSGGEPLRNPDAYPTGKNFYGIDPDKVPKKAAWAMGVKLADEMLQRHLEKHGRYPRKVSFVIWGDETMRHEGVLESQIFHLLGTRPVWDARDKVVDVEVIPSAKLGRPRVDIVIASAAEGMFSNVTMLMDKAVQQVKLLEEAENYVREHYLATRAQLISMGYSEEDADRRAGVRIFDEPPGHFNLNTSSIAAASGSWDSDIGMANDYINKMGHGYGNGFWGEPMQDVFKLALKGVESIVHSSSTTLYGALDNDDFFMYMGGLAAAVRSIDGLTPELLVTNTRDPGRPAMTSIDEFIGTEFLTRYVNPQWIEGMQAEGYAGARVMVEFVEYLWGWDATVTEVVNDAMWQEVFEVYIEDKHDLNMNQFFQEQSPYALQDMVARMIETVRKDYWEADDATLKTMLENYASNVAEHGINCTDLSCGNPRLMRYMLEEGERLGVSGVDLAALRAAVEAATRGNIEAMARQLEEFVQANEARIQEASQAGTRPGLEGYRMERRELRAPAVPQSSGAPQQHQVFSYLVYGLLLVILLIWRRARRRSVAVESPAQ